MAFASIPQTTTSTAPPTTALGYSLQPPPESLGARTARGFVWLLAQTVGGKLINIGGQVVLAWLLRPADFGRVGLAYTVSAFGGLLMYAGVREILVQRQEHFGRWVNAAFWLSLVLGIASAVVMAVTAPVVARIYGAPEVTGLVMVLAANSAVSALATVPEALMRIRLLFRMQAVSGFLATVATTGLSILIAWRWNWGAYAFVVPLLVVSIARTAALWAMLPAPVRARPQVRRWKYLIGDSGLLLGFALCSTITLQGDYVLLGLLHTKEAVGYYFFAFNLSTQTVQLLGMNLAGVLFPALSRMKEEPKRQAEAFLSALRVLTYVGVPACFIQAALAEPVMRLMFHPKWEPAIAVVQVHSVGMAWLLYGWQAGALMQAQGRFRTLLLYGVFAAFAFLGLVLAGALAGGPVAVAVAVGFAFAVLAVSGLYAALRPTGAGWGDIMRWCLGPMGLALLAVGPVAVFVHLLPAGSRPGMAGQIVAGGLAAAGLYAVLLRTVAPGVWGEIGARLGPLLRRGAKGGV